MLSLPDLDTLSDAEKNALIRLLAQQVDGFAQRIAELEARLNLPPKDPDNSSLPPSRGQKPDVKKPTKRTEPRSGSVGRMGGGRPLAETPDQTIEARPTHCMHCRTALGEADCRLSGRYDKIDIPPVRPIVTRVERYTGHCPCCGETTITPVPSGMEEGSPFGPNIVATAIYLRAVHAISYQRLSRLFAHLFGLSISEGALDTAFRRSRGRFADQTAAILARLRRSRLVCSDETTIRVQGRTHWHWTFQNKDVALHVVRDTRAASVVREIMDGHRPQFWISDLYGAQQGHAEKWQVCLAHQLRDCQYAIDAGDAIFAPRMKALILRAYTVARKRSDLAESTLKQWRYRLDRDMTAIMALAPTNHHGKRLRKRYGKVRDSLFTFLEDPDVPPDNNGSEREIRPVATYRKVTGGFRSDWAPNFYANVRSAISTAARKGINAFHSIVSVLQGNPILQGG